MAIVSTFVTGVNAMQRLGGQPVFQKIELNFATTNAAALDVIEAIKVPAGAFVFDVWTYLNTAEGGTMTFDVGDGTDPNGYNDAVNGNAAAASVSKSLEATDTLAIGKFYSTADTIDVTLDNAADAMILTVVAGYFMLENVS